MPSLTVLLQSLMIGVVVITTLNHLILSTVSSDRMLHLSFAGLALLMAIFSTGTLFSYYSETIPEIVTAHRWRGSAACLFYTILPWFLGMFTNHRMPVFHTFLSLGFLFLLARNLVLPHSIVSANFERLDVVHLPWGETVIHGTGPATWELLVLYLLIFITISYAFYLSIITIRHGNRSTGLALFICLAVAVPILIFNFFVETGKIQFLLVGEYAFIGLIVTMSIFMSARMSWAYKKLSESEYQLRSIIDSTDAIIYIKDRNGRYRMINQKFEQLFGTTYNQLRGKSDNELFSPDHAEDLQKNDAEILQYGKSMEFEESVQLADGDHTYISLKVPLRDDAGRVYGLCGVSTDITERKRMERELAVSKSKLEDEVARQTDDLRRLNGELEAFSYSVSHDLRAPLRSINGFSHALLDEYKGKLDNQGQDFLGRICKATGKMNSMIDALLTLSKADQSEMKAEMVNLSALCHEILDDLKLLEPDRLIEIRIRDGMTVRGDPELLKIALTNLLSNAWKYTMHTPEPIIECGQSDASGECFYYVKDNGTGFDPERSDRLFSAFSRLHTENEFTGIGIGLSLVARIIKRHHGKVWAEGAPGKGATFCFSVAP